MAYTQLLEVAGADEQALHDHVAQWDAQQAGVAPGYLGARVLADNDRPGRHLVLVDFASEDQAKENNDREETATWAARLRDLGDDAPAYRNLREVCTTYR